MQPIIVSLYEGLFMGGARILHTEVVRSLHSEGLHRHSVLSLTNRTEREYTIQRAEDSLSYQHLQAVGIPVLALDRDSETDLTDAHRLLLSQFVRGADLILSLKEQPLSALLQEGTYSRPLITCLHRSDPQPGNESVEALLSMQEDGSLSRVIACSHASARAYGALGLESRLIEVVPNGIDLLRFHEDETLRRAIRSQLGIEESDPVVMIAARFDPLKNVGLFLTAGEILLQSLPSAHFLLVGPGLTETNDSYLHLFEAHVSETYRDRFHALGLQAQMPAYYNATDLTVLTSITEAAPLTLLEAMACGAVGLSTPVGDAELMLGDADLVTSFEPEEIAESWARAYHDRARHKQKNRERREEFSSDRTHTAYARIIDEALRT